MLFLFIRPIFYFEIQTLGFFTFSVKKISKASVNWLAINYNNLFEKLLTVCFDQDVKTICTY